MINANKLEPIAFTYATTLSSKPNESSKTFTWFAMDELVILCISNIPIVTWVGSHELLIKLTTMTKVTLYPNHDIQRSKQFVHVIHNAREGQTYFSQVLSTTFKSTSFTSYHQWGNWSHPYWCKTNHFNHGFLIENKS